MPAVRGLFDTSGVELRYPEIEHDGLAIASHENIFRLQVSMNDACGMYVRKRFQECQRRACEGLPIRLLASRMTRKWLPIDELHDEKWFFVGHAVIDESNDAGKT